MFKRENQETHCYPVLLYVMQQALFVVGLKHFATYSSLRKVGLRLQIYPPKCLP